MKQRLSSRYPGRDLAYVDKVIDDEFSNSDEADGWIGDFDESDNDDEERAVNKLLDDQVGFAREER